MPECACLDTILTAGADVPCVQLRPAAAHKRAQTIGAALEHFGRLCRAHKLQIATVRLALPQAVSRCTRGKVLIVGSPREGFGFGFVHHHRWPPYSKNKSYL
jgi:hypothetical protein